MSHSAPPEVTYRIAVIATAARAYRPLRDNFGLAVALAWVPVIVTFATELIAARLESGGGWGQPLADFLRSATLLVFGSLFGARWYRFVLIGERQIRGFFPPGFARFLVVAIKFTLLCAAAAILFAVIVAVIVAVILLASSPVLTTPLGFAGGLAIVLLASRVSLVFPAAAIERPIGFRAAWVLLGGNYWRLVACAAVCYLPFIIAQPIVLYLGKAMPAPIAIVCQAIGVIVIFAGSAVAVGMFSDVYRNIAGIADTGVARIPD